MQSRIHILTAALFLIILPPLAAFGDVLHLKNGRQLHVEKAWQDSDQVWFIFQGMKASIPRYKVSGIVNDADHRPPSPPKESLVLRKDGFDDLEWGIKVVGVRGLNPKKSDRGLPEVIEYVRPEDPLKLGKAELASAVYAFWQDQLYTVTLWTQGPANYEALRETVFAQFGEGIQTGLSAQKYLWSNDMTDMMLTYSDESQQGMLWMRSKALDRKFKLSKMSGPVSFLKGMNSKK